MKNEEKSTVHMNMKYESVQKFGIYLFDEKNTFKFKIYILKILDGLNTN